MLRHLRRAVVCVLTAGLALFIGAPTASSALPGLQSVRLGCNDGTNLALALDPASTLALTSAVSAVNTYAAGLPPLTCTTSSSTTSAKNGPKDFVVGGGQAAFVGVFGNNACDANFSVSAHVPTGTLPVAPQSGAGGTFNLTNTLNKCLFAGHIVSKVDCVAVGEDPINNRPPGGAQITAVVTKSDGAYATLLLPGDEIEVDFLDSGLPGGAGDMIDVFQLVPPVPCFFGQFMADQPVDRGNINVKQGASSG
jgi:hypothetical protein